MIRKCRVTLLRFSVIILFVISGCSSGSSARDSGDNDADSRSDSDNDTLTSDDSDTATVLEGDTETDTGPAADAGSDTGVDSETTPHPDTGTDTDSASDSEFATDTASETATERDTDSDTPSNPNDSSSEKDSSDTDSASLHPFGDISVEIHPDVKTILVVHVTLSVPVDQLWVRYTFEDDAWLTSPRRSAEPGEITIALLGIPEQTEVQYQVVAETAGGQAQSDLLTGTTEAAPSGMPRPTILGFDPDVADPARWMLGSVEATPGRDRYYDGPFWIYIIDRQGRIVWYYSDRGNNPCMAYPRISPDNTYLFIEKRLFYADASYTPRVLRLTLDRTYFEEISVPDLNDCFDVTDDGTILFNTVDRNTNDGSFLKERLPDGTTRKIWDCEAWADSTHASQLHPYYCYSNTVNWSPETDSVLMSFPYINTVVEIDRESGVLLAEFGDVETGYLFSPDSWSFTFNHYPNFTPDGTLLVSIHEPGHADTEIPGTHYFAEFDVRRATQTLEALWSFGEGLDDWPMYKGEAHPTPSGNLLVNYGTGGVIREVTREKETVWHVKWDADFRDDHFNLMVGHSILLDDLYALQSGWDE